MNCGNAFHCSPSTLIGWWLPVLLLFAIAPASAAAEVAIRDRVEVTLVGSAADDADFRRLLVEWDAELEINQAPALNAADVLNHPATGGQLRIWVVLASPQMARVYFADPSGERFLVREVPLATGLDESGRETLAQVIATSALAFEEQAIASRPSEIAASFSTQAATGGPPLADTNTFGSPLRDVPRPLVSQFWLSGLVVPRKTDALHTQWHSYLGIAYSVSVVNAARLGHGLGALVALDRAFEVWRLSFAVKGQYRFPLEIRDVDGTIRLNTVSLATRTALERRLVNDWALGFDVGIGIERTSFGLTPAPVAAVMSRSGVSYRPVVPLGLRGAHRWSSLEVALLVGIDVALVRTHYDIGTRAAFTPWIVQPHFGVELSL